MIIGQAFGWVFDPANYAGPDAVPERLWEHIWISLLAVLIASVIAIPIGYAIGHTGKARGFAIALSGGIRALPTLGVLTLVGLMLGANLQAPCSRSSSWRSRRCSPVPTPASSPSNR